MFLQARDFELTAGVAGLIARFGQNARQLALACLIAFAAVGPAAHAEDISAEKRELIDALLEQTGQSAAAFADQLGGVFVQQMMMFLRQSNPNLDPKAAQIIEEEVMSLVRDELINNDDFYQQFYPIYDKYFSADDLQNMVDFNATPTGRKVIETLPMITQESMEVGRGYGEKLAPLIEQRLSERFEAEGIL